MRIGIAADHQGFELKKNILNFLYRNEFDVCDYGASVFNPTDDYPDFIIPLARAISNHEVDRGIAICGTGVGVCIASNKIKNVRAGIIHDVFSAQQGVEDDNMNMICLGARVVAFPLATRLIHYFLLAQFSDQPRFARRLLKVSQAEELENLYVSFCQA